MPLVFDASTDELQFFLQEAEEQFQILDDGLLELERGGAKGDLLQEIFRAAHTLKGSSATIGHGRMAELTHHLEDILDKLRRDEVAVSTTLVDAGLQALDALRHLSEEVSTLEEVNIDINSLLATLASVQVEPRLAGGGAESQYRVLVAFEPDHPLMVARALQLVMEIDGGGHIVDLVPGRSAIENAEFEGRLQAIVEWPQGRDHLARVLATVPDVATISVEPIDLAAGDTPKRCTITVSLDEMNDLRAARAMQLLLMLDSHGSILSSTPSAQDIESERIAGSLVIEIEPESPISDIESTIQSIPDIVNYAIADFVDNEAVPAAARDEISNGRRKQATTGNTIRMSVDRIDRMLDYVGELVIERSRISATARNLRATAGSSPEIDLLVDATGNIELLISQIHEELMMGRMLPIDSVLRKFPRLVRDLAHALDKDIEFTLDTGDVELDRTAIEAVSDPLIHLVRNAVDHGIEPAGERTASGKCPVGQVSIAARQIENRIVVVVADDGKGIDPEALRRSAVAKGLIAADTAARLTDLEALNLIFQSGFSTAKTVTGVSGRGVGMDIVRRSLESIGATIEIASRPGCGTEFTIRLPLTLAIIRALLVRCDRWSFSIPLDAVIETVRLSDRQIDLVGRRKMMRLRDQIVPVIHLSESLANGKYSDGDVTDSGYAVVLTNGGNPLAVLVDGLVGEQEVVVKPFGAYIPQVPGISGATILGDGSFSLIVDVGRLASREGVDHGSSYAA